MIKLTDRIGTCGTFSLISAEYSTANFAYRVHVCHSVPPGTHYCLMDKVWWHKKVAAHFYTRQAIGIESQPSGP